MEDSVKILTTAHSAITGSIAAHIRKWRGTIDERFSNIDNVLRLIQAHQPAWDIPPELLAQLTDSHSRLQALISKCRSITGSPADRSHRNALFKSTVALCLLQVKVWAYGLFVNGTLTAADVHQLGFMLPGEAGGRRSRKEATSAMAEVKVHAVNEDFIRVVIDHSGGENAAQTAHGWPAGVRNALIVVVSADTKTEVVRHMTTRLHNDIRMPDGSHGKQFLIKAAFLRHVDDTPHFGNEPTFSMPLTTEDLIATQGGVES